MTGVADADHLVVCCSSSDGRLDASPSSSRGLRGGGKEKGKPWEHVKGPATGLGRTVKVRVKRKLQSCLVGFPLMLCFPLPPKLTKNKD